MFRRHWEDIGQTQLKYTVLCSDPWISCGLSSAMATAISVRPVPAGPRMRRPPPHSLHTTVNGVPPFTSSSSPSLGSKRPPSISASPGFGVNGVTTNGTVTRTSMRQRKESLRPSQSRHESSSITLDTPNDSHGVPKKLTEPYGRTWDPRSQISPS